MAAPPEATLVPAAEKRRSGKVSGRLIRNIRSNSRRISNVRTRRTWPGRRSAETCRWVLDAGRTIPVRGAPVKPHFRTNRGRRAEAGGRPRSRRSYSNKRRAGSLPSVTAPVRQAVSSVAAHFLQSVQLATGRSRSMYGRPVSGLRRGLEGPPTNSRSCGLQTADCEGTVDDRRYGPVCRPYRSPAVENSSRTRCRKRRTPADATAPGAFDARKGAFRQSVPTTARSAEDRLTGWARYADGAPGSWSGVFVVDAGHPVSGVGGASRPVAAFRGADS